MGRDIGFYLAGILVFMVMGFFDTPYWFVGTVLLVIYVIYVTVVYIGERKSKKTEG